MKRIEINIVKRENRFLCEQMLVESSFPEVLCHHHKARLEKKIHTSTDDGQTDLYCQVQYFLVTTEGSTE